MTRTERQLKAQQVRDDYRAARLQRLEHQALTEGGLDLADPVLPDNPVIDPADGTLNKDALEQDLAVEVLPWSLLPPNPALISVLDLLWVKAQADGSAPLVDKDTPHVDRVEVRGPPESITFPLALKVPKEDLYPDGKYFLITRLKHYNSSTVRLYSIPMPLIADSEPPYKNVPPAAMTLPNEPITDAYLTAHGDKVIGTIPSYDTYAPGDRVTYYWGLLSASGLPESPVFSNTIDVTGEWPLEVEFGGEAIRLAGDGGCYAGYTLTDKATNTSLNSVHKAIGVALGPLPAGLQDPEVPLAADGLVDLEDAIDGVFIEIPVFTGHKPADFIYAKWGTTELFGKRVDYDPEFPLSVRVPPTALQSNYTNATGEQDTVVSYVVTRGTVPSETRSTIVKVDFSVPGPPRPDPDLDWPDPINPALSQAEVRGESDLENELTRDDEGKDATLTFVLYDSPAVGQVLSFWWDGVEVVEAEYEVKDTDEKDDEIPVTIPWSYILQGFNNPALPVWYQLGEVGAANQQQSPVTYVNADAVNLRAPVPAFLGLDGAFLNCESLYADPDSPDPLLEPAIRVSIPDLSQVPFNLKDGDQVTLSWKLFENYDTTVPIEEAKLEETVTLDEAHPATGFTWYVQPYATHVLPAFDPEGTGQDGTGQASYSFVMNGNTVYSYTTEAYVSLHDGENTCLIPPSRRAARK